MDTQQPVQQQPNEQPINQQPVQPVPVVTRPPQNSWKIIILVIVGILVLGGASYGAYYFWQKYNKPAIAPIDETADWKTYENKKFEFSFAVPNSWQIKRENEDVGNGFEFNTTIQSSDFIKEIPKEYDFISINNGAAINIRAAQSTNIKTMDELIEFWSMGRGGHKQLSEKIMTIAGEKALFHELGDYRKGGLKDIHISYKDRIIDIEYSYAEERRNELEELFDKILSTFKFTDKETITEKEARVAVEKVLSQGSLPNPSSQMPKGIKLLSVSVVENKITLDFSKEILSGGQGVFEDIFSLVSNAIHPIIQGNDINSKFSSIEFVVLIEGRLK